jgi:hypothetical protein
MRHSAPGEVPPRQSSNSNEQLAVSLKPMTGYLEPLVTSGA